MKTNPKEFGQGHGDMKRLSRDERNAQLKEYWRNNPEAWLEQKRQIDELRQKKRKGILEGLLTLLSCFTVVFALALPYWIMQGNESWIAVCIRIAALVLGMIGAVTVCKWTKQ